MRTAHILPTLLLTFLLTGAGCAPAADQPTTPAPTENTSGAEEPAGSSLTVNPNQSAPRGTPTAASERAGFGVAVPEEISWELAGTVGGEGQFAPSIVGLPDGRMRLYMNDYQQKGIVSAVSSDGVTFAFEDGLRLANGTKGDLDCIASHPWVMAMDGGYRMYYQGDPSCVQGDAARTGSTPFRVMSAFSEDGITFAREGVRVDVGEATGLSEAVHGRIAELPDGTYRMLFSAKGLNARGPVSVYGATSADGLAWNVDDEPTVIGLHDPALIWNGTSLEMYAAYQSDTMLKLTSADGYHFTPVAWITATDAKGATVRELGDVEVFKGPDGTVRFYAGGKGLRGVGIFVEE